MKKQRQYRSRQGRSDDQYENDAKVLFYTLTGGIASVLIYAIVNFIQGL